jgi:hypothetical protein
LPFSRTRTAALVASNRLITATYINAFNWHLKKKCWIFYFLLLSFHIFFNKLVVFFKSIWFTSRQKFRIR